MKRPKIVMGVPTYAGKNYAWHDFQRAFHQIDTDAFDVVKIIVDNTDHEGNRKFFEENAHGWDEIFHIDTRGLHVNDKLAKSHNMIREYTLRTGADFMFHVESDVIVPPNALNDLYIHKKRVIGGWYMLHTGADRYPIHCPWDLSTVFHFQYQLGHGWHYFLEPGVQEAGLVGIGCCLMKASLLKRLIFRYDPDNPVAPDTNASKDCKMMGVKWWVNNDILCYHMNDLGWGKELKFLEAKDKSYE